MLIQDSSQGTLVADNQSKSLEKTVIPGNFYLFNCSCLAKCTDDLLGLVCQSYEHLCRFKI